MKLLYVLILSSSLMACSHAKCHDRSSQAAGAKTTDAQATAAATGSTGVATTPAVAAPAPKGDFVEKTSAADHVKVYKPDGSRQCGQGKVVPVAEMQKDLDGIKVFSSFNKMDGMMHPQMCGAPTGKSNVYEINRKDLEAAIKKGFREWSFE